MIEIHSNSDFAEKLAAQERFWRGLFPKQAFDFNPEKMVIWPRRPGFDRLIVTPRGLWENRLHAKFERLFPCSEIMLDLDKIIHSSGSPYVTTARWFRDRQEADEELKNKSALKLEKLLIPGMNLVERFNYELVFFEETGGDHLDKKYETYCTGSRDSVSRVPHVRWSGDSLEFNWCYPNVARADLCAREVAS